MAKSDDQKTLISNWKIASSIKIPMQGRGNDSEDVKMPDPQTYHNKTMTLKFQIYNYMHAPTNSILYNTQFCNSEKRRSKNF